MTVALGNHRENGGKSGHGGCASQRASPAGSHALRVCSLRAARMMALAALLLSLPACNDHSYALVSVLTESGSVSGVAQFRVVVHSGADQDVLSYPRQPTANLTLDDKHAVTFSVEFDSSRSGDATFEVEPRDRSGVSLGKGSAAATLAKEGVVSVTVRVSLAGLLCSPYAPATTCGAGATCGLVCEQGMPAAGICYPAGSGKPGEVCASNSDCAPGSQCFDFSTAGCPVKTCLRFCDHDDAACDETDAYCNVPIACGTGAPFLACSRPCDPAVAGTTGCASGLGCFVYADETTDCACPGTGTVGSSCTQNSDCTSGTSCIVPVQVDAGAGTGACRPICRLASPACPGGLTCRPFDQAKRNLYGYCQ